MKSKILKILALLIISCMLLSVFPTYATENTQGIFLASLEKPVAFPEDADAEKEDNIVLDCSDNVRVIAPGDEGEFKISVTNLGGDDTIELSAWVPSNWIYSFTYQTQPVNNITLKQNETKSVKFSIYVSEDAEIKEHSIIIFGESSTESQFMIFTVVVKKSYDIEINAKEKIIVVPEGGHTETSIELRNIGENEGYVNLSVSSDLADIKSSVFLSQGKSENISLLVHAPFNFTYGNYLINITATFFNTNISVNITVRVVKPTKILLVEKEKAQNLRDALNDTFYNYDIANLSRIFLCDYDLVIWYCGKKWFDTVTLSEQQNLSNYLDNGGNLWLIGQDIIHDLYNNKNDFVRNYLHVVSAEQDKGVPNPLVGMRPVFDNVTYSVVTSVNDFADDVTPDNDSFGIFSGKNNYSAIGYSGVYRVVFFAFDITALNDSNARTAITDRVIKWFLELPFVTITCANNISTVAPGNLTAYTITVINSYPYQDQINFTIHAPLRWNTYFNRTVTLDANETRNIDIVVQVPQNVQTGIYQIRIVGRSLYAGNISLDLEVRVASQISVLLVEDSKSTELRDILNRTILVYDTYLVDANGFGPSSEIMQNYSIVIWNVGSQWNNTLTAQDQENISEYLDSGGALWLLGQDILYDLGVNDFVTQYLHVATADQDGGLPEVMYCVPNNPVVENISCSIATEKDDFADALTPDNNATGLFFGNVNYSAISYFKAYKVVFFAFDFLRIANEIDQDNVVSGVLNWLVYKEPLITIETICFSKANPEENEIIEIYANISNQGNKGSENITVRFIIDNYIAGERNISALQEGEWYNTSITWKAVKGMHLVKVEVEHISSTKVLEVAEKKKEIEISPYVIYIAVFMCIIAFGAVFLHMWRKRR